MLAFVVNHSSNKLRRQADKSVELCLFELPESARTSVSQQSIVHTCCAFLELAYLWYKPIDLVLAQVASQHISERYLHSDQGNIIIAPHHGSWELLNLWLAQQGPLFSLYKPARSKKLDEFVLYHRTRNGAQLVPGNTAGLRKLLCGLKDGANVMILPDQRPAAGTAQAKAMFFSHPAPTSLLIKNLAGKAECEIHIAAATRDLSSGKFHIRLESLDKQLFLQDDIASAQYLNSSIEQFVAKEIEQYQWPYRRFARALYSR